MKTTTAVGIVAHVNRIDRAKTLHTGVGADVLMEDDGTLGGKANHIRTIEWLYDNTESEWLVVLEDDALPIPMFRMELKKALHYTPAKLVSLYLGRSKPEHWQNAIQAALAVDVSWLKCSSLLHGVGYVLHRSIVPDLLFGSPINIEDSNLPIDEAISTWAVNRNMCVAYTRPSMVDHADIPNISDSHTPEDQVEYQDHTPDDVPTSGVRKAWLYGCRNWDASQWTIQTPEFKFIRMRNGAMTGFHGEELAKSLETLK